MAETKKSDKSGNNSGGKSGNGSGGGKEDPGPSVKDPDVYEALRDDGASKEKAARIANAAANSSRSKVGKKGGKSGSYGDWTRDELYQRAQAGFDHKAAALIQEHGLGHRVRIDPTIISTDIEDNRLGKALGADRALELIRAQGADPASFEWFTVGDSRTDYAMADRLHELGLTVSHVDVRPSDGIPEGKPYTIKTMPGVIHDDAGLAFLEEISASLSR